MKISIPILILMYCHTIYGEDRFDYKIYTPEVVVDKESHGDKGSVQLIWQKSNQATRYELEVTSGKTVYSNIGEKHFHHVMLYFNKDYRWRVREVSSKRTTSFSDWQALKVVKSTGATQGQVIKEDSPKRQVTREADEYILDTGE